MNYIFADNYRGFSNTIIPITDVNFLVGENSTGKTSILGLLKLIAPRDYWLNNELDIKKVGFSTFKDVVSISSDDQSYFTVGMIYEQPQTVVILMKFIEKEGMPVLSSLFSYRNGFEIQIKYTSNNIKYKRRKTEDIYSAQEIVESKILEWSEYIKNDNKGYKILKEADVFFRGAPPIIILSHLEDALFKNEAKNHQVRLEIPAFFEDITWLAPIRTKPRKTYDEYSLEFSPEGNHTPYLIKKKLDNKSESVKFKKFINDVGVKSGLFKEITTKNYGRGSTSPFELDIVLNEQPLSVSSVGYGVSQILPVIVEMFSRSNNSWYAIQQPEVHLHPKAQAALGEVIFNLANIDNKKFIIETHSDYTIDRFRISCRKAKHKVNSQILFFERTKTGNKVTSITIDSDGNLSSDMPDTYREFFIKEDMELLGL